MLNEKGPTWKAAKASWPPSRQILHTVRNKRIVVALGLLSIFMLLWRSMGSTSSRSHCLGPTGSPLDMMPNDMENLYAQYQTPVMYNIRKPIEVNAADVEHIDLNTITSTPDAVKNKERVLILTPLRDAAYYLGNHFDLLTQLTYPHELIDLAFLIGDTNDETRAALAKELERVQGHPSIAFRSAMIVEKDFGVQASQSVDDRHDYKVQGPRRKALGKARNYLLSAALKPEHSWVYWRDVDIKDSPPEIIEDFVMHDRDILVPNIWFHRWEMQNGKLVDIEGRFDYNSWQESPEGLALAASLPKDTIMAEGYKELDTKRNHMCLLGDRHKDKHLEMPLDAIGGVNILVKADVHRAGINFPCYAFENQAETEGFAKMAKRAGYEVYGLPNYIVWHIDTLEKPGNAKEKEE